ncbi:MAG: hypothetical protein HY244_13025 [Rhizobiales bacterium]|nr:hypothetical protein [Hyphomicrobiales bacterium]
MALLHRIGMLATATALIATGAPASAAPLSIVEVGFPAVNCLFQASCTIVVSDSSSTVNLGFDSGSGFFQSRIWNAAAGTPAAGKTGYLYRLDLRGAAGFSECVVGVTMNFGPVAKLPYKSGSTDDVFVGTSGGLGTIKLKSAEQDGSVITFTFAKPVCAKMGAVAGETTFFFGLASTEPPHSTSGTVFTAGSPGFYAISLRAPNF